MLIRPSTEAELDRVLDCASTDDPVGLLSPGRYRADLATGNYLPKWTWLAEDGGQVVAAPGTVSA